MPRCSALCRQEAIITSPAKARDDGMGWWSRPTALLHCCTEWRRAEVTEGCTESTLVVAEGTVPAWSGDCNHGVHWSVRQPNCQSAPLGRWPSVPLHWPAAWCQRCVGCLYVGVLPCQMWCDAVCAVAVVCGVCGVRLMMDFGGASVGGKWGCNVAGSRLTKTLYCTCQIGLAPVL